MKGRPLPHWRFFKDRNMKSWKTIAAIGIAVPLFAFSAVSSAQTTTGDNSSANADGMSGSSSMSTGSPPASKPSHAKAKKARKVTGASTGSTAGTGNVKGETTLNRTQ
jgi:hypothetical protein